MLLKVYIWALVLLTRLFWWILSLCYQSCVIFKECPCPYARQPVLFFLSVECMLERIPFWGRAQHSSCRRTPGSTASAFVDTSNALSKTHFISSSIYTLLLITSCNIHQHNLKHFHMITSYQIDQRYLKHVLAILSHVILINRIEQLILSFRNSRKDK